VTANNECWIGWEILIFGPLAVFTQPWPVKFPWFANGFLLACWITTAKKQRKNAMKNGAISFLLASSFLTAHTFVNDEGQLILPIKSIDSGYWLWLTSIILACIAAIRIEENSL